jgi:hypothetical protein
MLVRVDDPAHLPELVVSSSTPASRLARSEERHVRATGGDEHFLARVLGIGLYYEPEDPVTAYDAEEC